MGLDGHFEGSDTYLYVSPFWYDYYNYNGNYTDMSSNGKVYSHFNVTDPNGSANGNQNCGCDQISSDYRCRTKVRASIALLFQLIPE
jgi:hypothetical protein